MTSYVTRDDLDQGLASLRGEMRNDLDQGLASLRSEMRNDLDQGLASLRSEMRNDLDQAVATLRGEIGELRSETRANFNALRSETRADLDQAVATLRSEIGELRTYVDQAVASLLAAMQSMESRLVGRIEGISVSLNEELKRHVHAADEIRAREIAVVDEKYRDLPGAMDRLRTDVDEHIADAERHQTARPKPRPQRRRARRS